VQSGSTDCGGRGPEPYQSNGEGRLPSADLAFKVEGGPQEFEAKLISTGKNAFVVYQGQTGR
jgi:hypothetical protein